MKKEREKKEKNEKQKQEKYLNENNKKMIMIVVYFCIGWLINKRASEPGTR